MNIKLVVVGISGCVAALTIGWLWVQAESPTVLYEVQSDTSAVTGSIKKSPVVRSIIIGKKVPIIDLNEEIFKAKRDLQYWDKEQRSYQVYQPPVNSKARNGWIKDYNAAKSHKRYYKKQLDGYKAQK